MDTLMENELMEKEHNINKLDWDELTFDIYPTKSMFVATCEKNAEWTNGDLVPYGDVKMSPASGVLNYGQGVFEGIKAFRTAKERVVFFRHNMNAKRFFKSCNRICIPPVPVDMFINAINQVVEDNIEYIPPMGKGSLYVRPVAWGTGPVLGVKPSPSYTFLVFTSPVGPYFKGGVKPLNLKVTNEFHRAAPRGIGNAKAIGNYSASLYPRKLALMEGYDEVIYLNAGDDNLVEEVGSANLFSLKGNILRTPRLAGSILAGVTRDSVIKIAKDILALEVQEVDLTLDDLLDSDETFCTGTAVVVTPIGKIKTDDAEYIIGDGEMGENTQKLRKLIQEIQLEIEPDHFGWIKPLKKI